MVQFDLFSVENNDTKTVVTTGTIKDCYLIVSTNDERLKQGSEYLVSTVKILTRNCDLEVV
jgi:hypothetical protein